MIEALTELMEPELKMARDEGIRTGRDEGEDRYNNLLQQLIQNGKQEDLYKVINDTSYRAALYGKYKIK